MSVSPLPSEPVSSAAADDDAPTLRLVPPHEHEWQLRSVEYDDGIEVRRYECDTCDDVLFR